MSNSFMLPDMAGHSSSDYFTCKHTKTSNYKNRKNCYDCGVYLPDNDQGFKSMKMKYNTFYDPHKCYKSSLKQRVPSFELKSGSDYLAHRNTLVDMMWDVGEKLRLQLNTIHLAIYFMDFIQSRQQIASAQHQLYGATCVMLAAKSVELDEKIPFITKLKRYSGLSNKTDEFTKAENVLVKELNWNLQCVTLIDLIEYFLCQGVIYKSDLYKDDTSDDAVLKEKKLNIDEAQNKKMEQIANQMNELSLSDKDQGVQLKDLPESKIYYLCQKIEREYLRLANFVIRDPEFLIYDQKILSCASIAFLRKVIGITNAWSPSLEALTEGLKFEIIESCYQVLVSKFMQFFKPSKVKPMNSNTKIADATEHAKLQLSPVKTLPFKTGSSNVTNENLVQGSIVKNENYTDLAQQYLNTNGSTAEGYSGYLKQQQKLQHQNTADLSSSTNQAQGNGTSNISSYKPIPQASQMPGYQYMRHNTTLIQPTTYQQVVRYGNNIPNKMVVNRLSNF